VRAWAAAVTATLDHLTDLVAGSARAG
jgi:hypothetical protein